MQRELNEKKIKNSINRLESGFDLLFEIDAKLVRSLCFSYLNEMTTNSRLAFSRLKRYFHPPPPPPLFRRRLFAVISLMTFPLLLSIYFPMDTSVDPEFHDPTQRSSVSTFAETF